MITRRSGDRMSNLWKSISEFIKAMTAEDPGIECSECGERRYLGAPGGPRHKCSTKNIIKTAIYEYEKEKNEHMG